MKTNNHVVNISILAILSMNPVLAAANGCSDVPNFTDLKAALSAAAPDAGTNGGFNFEMWGTIVNREGEVEVRARVTSRRNKPRRRCQPP